MTEKQKLMEFALSELKKDTSAAKLTAIRKGKTTDIGLVNHFALHDIIPNKWFDWVNRANASIMIVGQDWGPYSSLMNYITSFESQKSMPEFDYEKFLFQGFSSRTEKFILKAITEGYTLATGKNMPHQAWSNIIFTMSVLFTRQGKHFRGTEFFDNEKSRLHSFPYLAKQIEIVQPKVIMTLGGMAWQSVSEYFKLRTYKGKTVTTVISEISDIGYLTVGDTIVIPNFHPASHVSPTIMKNIWKSKPFLDALTEEN
jgi:hypothetical protein